MQLFKTSLNIDFLNIRKIMMVISIILIVTSIGSLAKQFLNLGLDFTGGTLIEVGYQSDADLRAIRNDLASV